MNKIKRRRLFSLCLLALILFCGGCNQAADKDQVAEDSPGGIPAKVIEDIPAADSVLLFDANNIYYFSESVAMASDDAQDMTLYRQNLETKAKTELAQMAGVKSSANVCHLAGDKLYYTCNTLEASVLWKIDINGGAQRTLKEWRDNTIFARVYGLNDKIVLFCQKATAGRATYTVEIIDPKSQESDSIMAMARDSSGGEELLGLDTDQESIYGYVIAQDTAGQIHKIVQYNAKGEETAAFILPSEEIDAFLTPENTPNEDTDAIFSLEKAGDFFILRTLNGRIKIYQQEANSLTAVTTPSEFYQTYPGGWQLIAAQPDIYFVHTYKAQDNLYRFDTKTGDFFVATLPFTTETINSCYGNGEGDLLIKKLNLENPEIQDLTLIKSAAIEFAKINP